MENSEVTGICIFTIYALASELLRHFVKHRHFENAYWGERRGRIRVEQEMRRLTEIQLNTTDGFFVQPVANIQSCFRQCVGTPRQGMLVPSSRCSLVLCSNVSPEALDGLEEFSHVWLTFSFHLNTNRLKEARAFAGTVKNDSRKYTFTAKITPPMLKEKKGVFSTRSPHRPNPIGVTLAKIEKVDKKNHCIQLSACDLVDGTPVLDIKPYVPAYDTVTPFRIPTWIEETIDTRNTVTVSEKAISDVEKIKRKLKQYKNDPQLFMKGLVETLEADVRSKFQTKRRIEDASRGLVVEVPFDEAIVRFFWKESRSLEISEILHKSEITSVELEQQLNDEELLEPPSGRINE